MDLFSSINSISNLAIERIRYFSETSGHPLWGCFSGGKDSVVIKDLVLRSGVAAEWHYNVTSLDPPELIRFIKRCHPDVKFDFPQEPFFIHANRTKRFPLRTLRWCCQEYKERYYPTTNGQLMVMGIRAEESPRRAARWSEIQKKTVSGHRSKMAKNIHVYCPIIKWTRADVWEYIHSRKLPYSPLYDEGFDRMGCIGCPMAGKVGRVKQFKRWPKYEILWRRLFKNVWESNHGTFTRDGRPWYFDRKGFTGWEQVYNWWLNDEGFPKDISECGSMFDNIDLT